MEAKNEADVPHPDPMGLAKRTGLPVYVYCHPDGTYAVAQSPELLQQYLKDKEESSPKEK